MKQQYKSWLAGALLLIALVALARAIWAGPDVGDLAESDDAKERLQAVALLRGGGGGDAAMLEQLARDPDPTVAVEAINVMSARREPRYYAALTSVIQVSKQSPVRHAAAAALGQFEETSPHTLAAMMGETEESALRVGAAKGLARLGKIKQKETAPLLYSALSDPDPDVRIWAITGLYNICGTHFPGYDAAKPPTQQRTVILFIGDKLRERGLLK